MELSEIIEQIETAIVANGTGAITAEVLNPILLGMVGQINDLTGVLDDSTVEGANIIQMINALNAALGDIVAPTIYTGTALPTPILLPDATTGDYYLQNDGPSIINSFLFNGIGWVNLKNVIADSELGLETTWSSQKIKDYVDSRDSILALPIAYLNEIGLYIGVGAYWRLSSVIYGNVAPETVPISNATEGMYRNDLILANTSGGFQKVEGVESASPIGLPIPLINTIAIGYVEVFGAVKTFRPFFTDISNKLDKQIEASAETLLYIKNRAGAQSMVSISDLTGFANVKDFGAVGDGVKASGAITGTVDTAAFTLALTQGKDLYLPAGIFLLDASLDIPSNIRIVGAGYNKTIISMQNVVNGEADTYFNAFSIINRENVSISDIGFTDGSHDAYEELLTFSEACAGIYIWGEDCKNIKVKNCEFTNIYGHGLQDNTELSYNKYTHLNAIGCSQNGLNTNGLHSTINFNYGAYNGFGLIEAGTGNSIIMGNVAEFNYNAGISVGGYNAEITNGHGDNNVIIGNICNNNVQKGLNITIGCVSSHISGNIIYKNGQFGAILYDTFNKQCRNVFVNNTIYDNGTDGGVGKQGLFVNSNGNYIANNLFFNTASAVLSADCQDFGINIEFDKLDNTLANNSFYDITNKDIYVGGGCTNTNLILIGYEKVYVTEGTALKNNILKTVIAYNGQPLLLTDSFVYADNASSSKAAILPSAEFYKEGSELVVCDTVGAAATNNITVTAKTGEKLNGVTEGSFTLDSDYQTIKLINIRSTKNWIITSICAPV